MKHEINLIVWGTPTKFYISEEVARWVYKGSYEDYLKRCYILLKYKIRKGGEKHDNT